MANKPITPTSNISATSTVSGTVRGLKHITSGSIAATSTVSGSIRRVKFISGSINATTVFSATILLKPGNILPASIMATCTIHEINLIIATVAAGSYGVSDTEDGII